MSLRRLPTGVVAVLTLCALWGCRRGSTSSCLAETDAAFCVRLGKACGAVSAADSCGSSRTVSSCGDCAAPLSCGGGGVAGVCGSPAASTRSDLGLLGFNFKPALDWDTPTLADAIKQSRVLDGASSY